MREGVGRASSLSVLRVSRNRRWMKEEEDALMMRTSEEVFVDGR